MDLYNGVYIKQTSTINGYDWFIARNDVGTTDASSNTTLYFSTSHNRWVIEAPDIYWEANITAHSLGQANDASLNMNDDRRRIPHLFDIYFGTTQWFQFSTIAVRKHFNFEGNCLSELREQ